MSVLLWITEKDYTVYFKDLAIWLFKLINRYLTAGFKLLLNVPADSHSDYKFNIH